MLRDEDHLFRHRYYHLIITVGYTVSCSTQVLGPEQAAKLPERAICIHVRLPRVLLFLAFRVRRLISSEAMSTRTFAGTLTPPTPWCECKYLTH